MKNIIIKPLHHRGKEVMGVYFEQEALLNKAIKQIKDVKWSRTNGCWYLPCNRQYFLCLCNAVGDQAQVDSSQLKQYLQQKQGMITDTAMPLHRATATLIHQYPLNDQNLQALIAYRNLLIVKKYSNETIRSYCNAFHQLLRLLGTHFIGDFTKERVHSYLLWLVQKRKCSETGLNTAINALKFYFEKVRGGDREVFDIPRPRMPKMLPDVLAEEEVVTLLSKIDNLKHRALIMTSYSMGLRVSELVNLKLGDIDSKRMMVHIRLGKGKKDRYVPLSVKVLEVLREYCKQWRPKEYLFEGQSGGSYSTRSAQEVIMNAKARARIRKTGSIHGLRHTFATHLLENGTDIRYIQELLGHTNLKTTMRYTHVAQKAIGKIQSPIDRLNL